MPRFYLDITNGHGEVPDEDGLELEGQYAAHQLAIDSVRSIVAEETRKGIIDLNGRIDVCDEDRNILLTVPFAEAFELRMPGLKAEAPR